MTTALPPTALIAHIWLGYCCSRSSVLSQIDRCNSKPPGPSGSAFNDTIAEQGMGVSRLRRDRALFRFASAEYPCTRGAGSKRGLKAAER